MAKPNQNSTLTRHILLAEFIGVNTFGGEILKLRFLSILDLYYIILLSLELGVMPGIRPRLAMGLPAMS